MKDSERFYTGLGDLLARRIALIFRHRQRGRVYDPTLGSGGDGWACSKCRRVMRSDRRVCPSCGTLNR